MGFGAILHAGSERSEGAVDHQRTRENDHDIEDLAGTGEEAPVLDPGERLL